MAARYGAAHLLEVCSYARGMRPLPKAGEPAAGIGTVQRTAISPTCAASRELGARSRSRRPAATACC